MSKRLAFGVLLVLIAWPALAEKEPGQILFLKFKTEADMPQDDGRGTGIEITDGNVDRKQHAIGVQLRTTRGTKRHERWTVQFLNPAGEVIESSELPFERQIEGVGTNCWFGVCGGLFLSSWRTFTGFLFPSCAIELGPDWNWRVLWEFSDDATPNWSDPEVVREGTFEWVLSKGALTISADKTIIHPSSENSTGGTLFTSFPGGTSGITVTASECGEIPPDPITVTLSFEVVANSGGHNHAAPNNMLVASLSQTSSSTDSNGKAFFGLTGRTVASFIKVKAETTDWDTTDTENTPVESEEFNMVVAIAGLQRFAPDNSFVFSTGDTTLHPDNIYGQPEMISFINLFAKAYFDDTTDRIRINDASLALGGKFDIFGGYTGSHAFHRFGVDVDVSKHVILTDGSLENWSADPSNPQGLNVDKLTAYVAWLGGTRYPEGPDKVHYRFPANGIDEIIATRILP